MQEKRAESPEFLSQLAHQYRAAVYVENLTGDEARIFRA